jgi:hypothetical protein
MDTVLGQGVAAFGGQLSQDLDGVIDATWVLNRIGVFSSVMGPGEHNG